jgi:hypothetical protein
MQTDNRNLWHKLHESVSHLATGSGSLKARLKNVLHSHLMSLSPSSNRPSEVERLITEVKALATAKKDETEIAGHVHVTLSSSHWKKDQMMAEKIFQAYELASKEYYRTEGD